MKLIRQHKKTPNLSSFSGVQLEVLKLAAWGRSNKEIGDTLGLKQNTVKAHVKSAYQKLGIERRTQLTFIVGAEFGTTPVSLSDIPASHKRVAELVSLGFTDAEIAALIGKSCPTVCIIVRDLITAMGVKNRTGVANVWLATMGRVQTTPSRIEGHDWEKLSEPFGPNAQEIARACGITIEELADNLLTKLRWNETDRLFVLHHSHA
ncbi:response regulator transcription factor [Thalassospira xianhensis]|uniref:response regulator transcription factor n=1 Tax=Thalassospira xianhensis TaxID=478503 RepID=UPI000DEDDF73|nr:helix-turn-helix transcriptional regulator [Thalassospira xianhensis]